MGQIDLNKVVANNIIKSNFLLMEKQLRPFNNKDGQFLTVKLMNKTGQIEGKLWEDGEEAHERLARAKVVEVSGQVQEYKGQKQLKIDSIADLGEKFNAEDFLPTLQEIEETEGKFKNALAQITAKCSLELATLIKNIFSGFYGRKFFKAPAALKFHHAYLGGLMLHTLNVARNATMLLKNYPEASEELVLCGALLHDLGKVKELTFDTTIEYSIEGNLLGHIMLGSFIIREEIERIRAQGITFSQEKENLLLHIIASHHGQLEWGALKQPQIIEALIVHHADMLDGDADKFSAISGEGGTMVWSPLLKRNVYIKSEET